MISNNSFIEACWNRPTPRKPVWMMRQAGRYLKEYRELRATQKMLALCQDPAGVCEVTLQPLRRFDFDAAILFSDITIPFLAADYAFDIVPGVGPVVATPVRSAKELAQFESTIDVYAKLPFITESIKLLKQELRIPLIGFAGAPFTLAAYLIEGKPSRDFKLTRKMMLSEPELWHRLMHALATLTADYLEMQIKAGVDAVQIFDSWVGGLSPSLYEQFIAPAMRAISARISKYPIPIIHFGTGTSMLLKNMHAAAGTVMGVDSVTPLSFARTVLGDSVPLQGNLDPSFLFASKAILEQEVRRICAEMQDRPGHIFNLGHGVLPETNPDTVKFVVDLVHSL